MTDEGSFTDPLETGTEGAAQFGTVAIIGVGLIGGSLGMALKNRRLARHVVGIGRNRERLAQAVALGAIDTGTTDLRSGLAEAQIIVHCTTVGNILETLGEVLEMAPSGAVVTDVGSTKSQIVARSNGAPRFIGGHPMAGSERTGVEAANPRLFQEATWALTPADWTDRDALHTVRAMAQEVGATTLITSPEAHDAMVAITSHLPHVIASSLMRQAAGARSQYPEIPRMAAGSFADMTRVAASSPDIWRDVCLSNRDAVLQVLEAFQSQFDTLKSAVEDRDAAEIEAFFASGATAKRDWRAL